MYFPCSEVFLKVKRYLRSDIFSFLLDPHSLCGPEVPSHTARQRVATSCRFSCDLINFDSPANSSMTAFHSFTTLESLLNPLSPNHFCKISHEFHSLSLWSLRLKWAVDIPWIRTLRDATELVTAHNLYPMLMWQPADWGTSMELCALYHCSRSIMPHSGSSVARVFAQQVQSPEFSS